MEIESAEELAEQYVAAHEGYSYTDNLADLIRADRRRVLEMAAKLCSDRAYHRKRDADSLAEHYGKQADEEASMYDADAMGSEALAKEIRALIEEVCK